MKKTLWFLLLLMISCMFALSACDAGGDHTHAFGEWTTLKGATCTEDGEAERVCSCGERETKSLNAGHTEVLEPAVAATCTANGKTEGKHCSVCEAVLVAQEEIPATGHKKTVTSKQILPTCNKEGVSEGAYCSSCREVLSEATVIPARGYDWILEDGEFKILMIGNSFTEDASNLGRPYDVLDSQLHTLLQAMLGDGVKVTVGIMTSGGKGMNWHASQAYANNAICYLQVVSSDNPAWRSVSKMTHADALKWANWDVVSVQPYEVDLSSGIENNGYPTETLTKFANVADSSAYLLDLVHKNAPQAEVYCYMHWALTTSTVLNANLNKYNQMAGYYPSFLEYQGTETGKQFTTLIPVGLAVQNARTTYLALLSYNTSAYDDKNLNYETDAQIGLQRDPAHLSFNIGRYIAALTFAEMVIPESLREEGYYIPNIRKTESIGDLPEEYSFIARSAVYEAVDSWRSGRLKVTEIEGYEKDPTTLFAESFAEGLTLNRNNTVDRIKKTVENSLEAQAVADLVIEKIEFPASITAGTDFKVTVTVRFGYTTLTFIVDCIF